MVRRYLPLNPLRAFEAAARHLSFTRAAIELNVTHAAVSQQVRALEEQLGCVLFTRVSRGLVLTHEGEGLLPVLNEAFDRIADTLECFSHGQFRERVKVGAVGTFAAGWLLPRLAGFITFTDAQPFTAAVRTASGVLHDFGLTAAIPAPCLCRDNINMQCAALRHGITAGDIKTEMQCTLLNIRQCADFQPDIRYPRNAVLFSLFADNVRRTEGFTKLAPSAVVIIGYGIAFYFLSLVLKSIPVGVAYAVWSGLGVVIITAIAWLLHGQKLDAWGFVGMGLIIAAFLLARSPSWKSLRRPTPW